MIDLPSIKLSAAQAAELRRRWDAEFPEAARLLGEHKRTPAQELEARLARFNRKQRRGMIVRAKKAARAAKKAEKS